MVLKLVSDNSLINGSHFTALVFVALLMKLKFVVILKFPNLAGVFTKSTVSFKRKQCTWDTTGVNVMSVLGKTSVTVLNLITV